jgi:hypothetical protein
VSLEVYTAPMDKGHTWVHAGMGGCYRACTVCDYACNEGCVIDHVKRTCIHPPCPGEKVDWWEWMKQHRSELEAQRATP